MEMTAEGCSATEISGESRDWTKNFDEPTFNTESENENESQNH